VQARAILNRVTNAGDWVLTPEDALYPVNLHRLADRPAALYCRGTMPDMDTRLTLAVVGTRRPSQEGEREAYMLACGLAAGGAIIVSGGAKGIDAAAHAGAMDGGSITVAVMGCPVDEEYPIENQALRQQILQNGGLLMSEYPHGEECKCIYQIRNRLLAGLSHGVCLGETPTRSGGLITARLAREQGKDLFALPGMVTGHRNDGAHREIRGGATLVTCATDVLEEYETIFPGLLDIDAAKNKQQLLDRRPTPNAASAEEKPPRRKRSVPKEPPREATASPATCPDTASAQAKLVYACLSDKPCPVDELAAQTTLSIPALLGALTELEMLGCAANAAGQQYIKR
jgi:DNA processing protein